MSDELASLRVRLEASVARFEAQLSTADRRMARTRRNFEGHAAGIERSFGGMAARVAALLAPAVMLRGFDRMITQLDEIGKTADRIGLTTRALQELRSAAEQSGVATAALDTSMQRFGQRLAEARQGTGAARTAFAEMGIALRDATGAARPMDAVLNDVADRMAATSDQTDRIRIATALFGREGVALVNMLRDGADGLDRMRAAARNVIDDGAIRNAEALRTEIDLLAGAANNAALSIGGALATALNRVFNIGGDVAQLGRLREDLESIQNLMGGRGVTTQEDAMRATNWLQRTGASDLADAARQIEAEIAAIEARLQAGGGVTVPISVEPVAPGRGATARPERDPFAEEIRRLERRDMAATTDRRVFQAEAGEAEKLRILLESLNRLREEGVEVTRAQYAELEMFADLIANTETETRRMEQAQRDAARATEDQARAMQGLGDRMIGTIAQARSLKDALGQIARVLLETGLQGALFGRGPFGAALGGGLLANADGNAFSGGRVVPFARGGVVGGPTTFPMAGNRVGLMGEAGPEAILPLKRGPGGRLGVEAHGGGGVSIVQNMTFAPGVQASDLRAEGERIKRETIAAIGAARRESRAFLA